MVTVYAVDEFNGSWKNRMNFLRLSKDPREVVFCDGRGKIVPLPYDVQAAVLELQKEAAAAVSLRDELRTLRGAYQSLSGKMEALKEDREISSVNIPVLRFVAIAEKVKKLFREDAA